MGRDKALVEVGGRTLLARAIATLRELGVERPVLACGSVARYADAGLPLALDEPDTGGGSAGPLGGLIAALGAVQAEWVCVLAVDLCRADARVFRALLSRAGEERADACLLESRTGLEPLYAVYRRATCLSAARAALAAGERRCVSFHPRIRVATVREQELEGELPSLRCATNLNTPADLVHELSAQTEPLEASP